MGLNQHYNGSYSFTDSELNFSELEAEGNSQLTLSSNRSFEVFA